jgi:hypothetical protein
MECKSFNVLYARIDGVNREGKISHLGGVDAPFSIFSRRNEKCIIPFGTITSDNYNDQSDEPEKLCLEEIIDEYACYGTDRHEHVEEIEDVQDESDTDLFDLTDDYDMDEENYQDDEKDEYI